MVLIDAVMPGPSTLDIIKNMRIEFPNVSILVMTSYSDMDFIIRCFKAGARGYFQNTDSIEHLIDVIKKVHRGETVLPPEVLNNMALKSLRHKSHIQMAHEVLTDRELEVMCLMASGKGLSYVAEILRLSPKTVSTHRNNVMKKMGWQNNAEMMFYAIRKGLVKEEFPEREHSLASH
jgi:two-component system, NarL family, invasion response regulator UvrY